MENEITSFDGGYSFLSNFFSCNIFYEGKNYTSSEHLYQSLMCLRSEDAERVRLAITPGSAKRIAHQVERNHKIHRPSAMLIAVTLKFFQNDDLMYKLLETRTMRLVEGNAWGDTYWGVCDGVGHNILGSILMMVRLNALSACLIHDDEFMKG